MAYILFGGIAVAEQSSLILTIKPPEVKSPESVPPGKYRRIIQPFGNWTLICDENLKAKTRVCNVTQTIIDQTGRTVFSWSVAATKEGKPYMILRTLPGLGSKGTVNLAIPDGRGSEHIQVDGCNDAVCVATVPIGPRLRPQIMKGSVIGISYDTATDEKIEISAPLAGIKDALKAI
ncbi:invasion associated locus B family protein [Brucella intermedia]|uniref:invasion associated locus B family protein n=1 Tax=Brucella intermedia TaxID=94625 RepID=UPI001879E99E